MNWNFLAISAPLKFFFRRHDFFQKSKRKKAPISNQDFELIMNPEARADVFMFLIAMISETGTRHLQGKGEGKDPLEPNVKLGEQ